MKLAAAAKKTAALMVEKAVADGYVKPKDKAAAYQALLAKMMSLEESDDGDTQEAQTDDGNEYMKLLGY